MHLQAKLVSGFRTIHKLLLLWSFLCYYIVCTTYTNFNVVIIQLCSLKIFHKIEVRKTIKYGWVDLIRLIEILSHNNNVDPVVLD